LTVFEDTREIAPSAGETMTKLSVGARKRALVSVAVEERNTHSINWAIQVRALALEIGCWN
jgi:hypothetical protein